MPDTDQETYDQAIGEQTQNTPETPVEAPTEAEAQRARDEKGRFKSAAPEPTTEVAQEPTPQPEAETPLQGESDARVPSWRLAEESQRRRDAEQSLNEIRTELRQMQQMATRQQQPPQPQQEPVDIFADPEGYTQRLESGFNQRLQSLQLENSLRFARYAHKDTFDTAYKGFIDHVQTTGDQASYQRIMASSDPGEALIQWHKERELQRELGGTDLKSFIDKQREEWLKDPQVQAKVIEAFKATQAAQPNSKLTNLPPSLSRATGAASSHDQGGDLSGGRDSYQYAISKR
jgi:hypothetical protein